MKVLFTRIIMNFSFILFTLFSGSALANILYIYNWTEYIPSALLAEFTKQTGIKVAYSTFESNEEMYAKLKLTKGGGYDLIFPSSYYVGKMIKEGMLQKIDHTKLSNLNQITPTLLNQDFDPNNQYSLPYVYGLTGIAVNAKTVDPTKITGWGDLWNPEYKGKVLLTADSREVFHLALLLNGHSPNTTKEKEIKAAYERLRALVPNVAAFNSDSPEVPYLQGEAELGMIWNGSAFRAHKENPNIRFIYPKEGAIFWIDNYAIPKNARHIKEAHQFIDFMLRPESAKIVIESMGFSMPNEGVKPLLASEDATNPVLFPPESEVKKGILQGDVGNAINIYEKYWNRLKTN